MSLSSTVVSLLPKILEGMDTNISSIEKMQSKYKMKRKISMITVCPVFLILVVSIAYGVYLVLGNLTLLSVLFGFLPLLWLRKKSPDQFKLIGGLRVPVLALLIIFTISATSILIRFVFEMIHNSDFRSILAPILLLLLLLLFFYGIFSAINEVIKELSKSIFKNRIVRIMLCNDEIIEGELVTINKHGDYIIYHSAGEENIQPQEILIHRNHIITVTLL